MEGFENRPGEELEPIPYEMGKGPGEPCPIGPTEEKRGFMNETGERLDEFCEIAARYDAFFLDQFGVVHDGSRA